MLSFFLWAIGGVHFILRMDEIMLTFMLEEAFLVSVLYTLSFHPSFASLFLYLLPPYTQSSPGVGFTSLPVPWVAYHLAGIETGGGQLSLGVVWCPVGDVHWEGVCTVVSLRSGHPLTWRWSFPWSLAPSPQSVQEQGQMESSSGDSGVAAWEF